MGRRLAEELARHARAAGVERFTAVVAAGSEPSLRLLRRIGRVEAARADGGDWEVTVALRRAA